MKYLEWNQYNTIQYTILHYGVYSSSTQGIGGVGWESTRAFTVSILGGFLTERNILGITFMFKNF